MITYFLYGEPGRSIVEFGGTPEQFRPIVNDKKQRIERLGIPMEAEGIKWATIHPRARFFDAAFDERLRWQHAV